MLWEHPIPFAIPHRQAKPLCGPAFASIRSDRMAIHPGEAPPMDRVLCATDLPFDRLDIDSYRSASTNTGTSLAVVDVARELYGLRRQLDWQNAPDAPDQIKQLMMDYAQECRDRCIALVARKLAESSVLVGPNTTKRYPSVPKCNTLIRYEVS